MTQIKNKQLYCRCPGEVCGTLTLSPIPAEQPGTQAVGLVQELISGALQPGLSAGTQVFQMVFIVGLHKALDSPGAPEPLPSVSGPGHQWLHHLHHPGPYQAPAAVLRAGRGDQAFWSHGCWGKSQTRLSGSGSQKPVPLSLRVTPEDRRNSPLDQDTHATHSHRPHLTSPAFDSVSHPVERGTMTSYLREGRGNRKPPCAWHALARPWPPAWFIDP